MKQFCFFVLLCFTVTAKASILEETVFVILSQTDQHHTKLSLETKHRLETSVQTLNRPVGGIFDATKDLHHHGSWTIFPLILHHT